MKAKITKRLLATLKPNGKRVVITDTATPGLQFRYSESIDRGAYSVLYRLHDGRRVRYSIGPASVFSPEQARDIANDVVAQAKRGEDPQATKRSSKELTFRKFVESEYGPWAKANNKTGAALVDVLLKVFPELDNKKMSEVSGWLIAKAQKRFTENGLKPASSNRYLDYLRSCLSKAVEWGFISEHPMKNVKSAKEDTSHVRYLSEDERKRLMDAINNRDEEIRLKRDSYNVWARERGYDERPDLRSVPFVDPFKPMVQLSLNTGMRRGEVFGLEWGDINFEKRIIKVRAENAKTGKARHLPMNEGTVSVLNDWFHQTNGKGLVFVSPVTGKRYDNVNTTWRQVLKSAGITNFRWHDMRHDFASRLVMAGADLYVVKELLGHSTIQMTERYAHLAPSATAAAVSLLDPQPQVKPKSTVKKSRKQKSS